MSEKNNPYYYGKIIEKSVEDSLINKNYIKSAILGLIKDFIPLLSPDDVKNNSLSALGYNDIMFDALLTNKELLNFDASNNLVKKLLTNDLTNPSFQSGIINASKTMESNLKYLNAFDVSSNLKESYSKTIMKLKQASVYSSDLVKDIVESEGNLLKMINEIKIKSGFSETKIENVPSSSIESEFEKAKNIYLTLIGGPLEFFNQSPILKNKPLSVIKNKINELFALYKSWGGANSGDEINHDSTVDSLRPNENIFALSLKNHDCVKCEIIRSVERFANNYRLKIDKKDLDLKKIYEEKQKELKKIEEEKNKHDKEILSIKVNAALLNNSPLKDSLSDILENNVYDKIMNVILSDYRLGVSFYNDELKDKPLDEAIYCLVQDKTGFELQNNLEGKLNDFKKKFPKIENDNAVRRLVNECIIEVFTYQFIYPDLSPIDMPKNISKLKEAYDSTELISSNEFKKLNDLVLKGSKILEPDNFYRIIKYNIDFKNQIFGFNKFLGINTKLIKPGDNEKLFNYYKTGNDSLKDEALLNNFPAIKTRLNDLMSFNPSVISKHDVITGLSRGFDINDIKAIDEVMKEKNISPEKLNEMLNSINVEIPKKELKSDDFGDATMTFFMDF